MLISPISQAIEKNLAIKLATNRPCGQTWPAICYGDVIQPMCMFEDYDPGGFYDEMFSSDGSVRPYCEPLLKRFTGIDQKDFLAL